MTRRRLRPTVVVALVVAVAVLAACRHGGEGDPPPEPGVAGAEAPLPPLHPGVDVLDRAEVTISTADGDEVAVQVRVAATADERSRGLMHVPELPPGVGMLFLFDEDRDGGFWMKDTLVPLDIAFVDADGAIGALLAMDPCEADPCPVYEPGVTYRAALEVPQGWFAEAGVAVGDELTWTEPFPDAA